MSKIILHVDLNQFFAAATCLLEPELKGKPLVIGHDGRRGIVSTASYEARKFGIHSAMPIYMAKQLCPKLIIREGNYSYYQEKSHQFFTFLKDNYSSIIEIVSIDEAYLDMTEAMKDVKDPYSYLLNMQKDIKNNIKLDVSIGLGATKFLAKMGSDYKKPRGITIIRKRDIGKILYPLDIKDFWGIGKKTVPKLREIGINTIGDFAKNESYQLKKILGKSYSVMKDWISGKGDDVVDPLPFDPKSISSSETFLYDTNDYEEITQMLKKKAKEVSEAAKHDKKVGKTITLILKDSNFKSITRSITINRPTNAFEDIYSNVMTLFDKFFNNQYFRLAGVSLSSLINKEDFYLQLSLFDQKQNQDECRTKLLINKLNLKANKKLFTTASKIEKRK